MSTTLSIPQAFEQFLESLKLTEREQSDASRQHVELREQLQQLLPVRDNFLSGSYKRRTAVRPLNDIDIFLVLRPGETLSRNARPSAVLGKIKSALKTAYCGKSARLQTHSVNIEFSDNGTGIAYDVVPAFLVSSEVYTIPDRHADRWIETNPRAHARLATQANERTNGKQVRLLKAVKHANQAHRTRAHKPARSFHLEVLSWSIVRSDPGSDLEGLLHLLQGLHRRICDYCPDPAGLGEAVQPEPGRCQEAQRWLTQMRARAQAAVHFARQRNLGAAHAELRTIFGKQWPG